MEELVFEQLSAQIDISSYSIRDTCVASTAVFQFSIVLVSTLKLITAWNHRRPWRIGAGFSFVL